MLYVVERAGVYVRRSGNPFRPDGFELAPGGGDELPAAGRFGYDEAESLAAEWGGTVRPAPGRAGTVRTHGGSRVVRVFCLDERGGRPVAWVLLRDAQGLHFPDTAQPGELAADDDSRLLDDLREFAEVVIFADGTHRVQPQPG